jgi:hypothetical protein
MRTTIVLVHGASRPRRFARPPEVVPMRRAADPLALEPLGPMGPIVDAYPPSDPLALDPLSPADSEARSIGAGESNSEDTSER